MRGSVITVTLPEGMSYVETQRALKGLRRLARTTGKPVVMEHRPYGRTLQPLTLTPEQVAQSWSQAGLVIEQ